MKFYSSHKSVKVPAEAPEGDTISATVRALEVNHYTAYIHAVGNCTSKSLDCDNEILECWKIPVSVQVPEVVAKVYVKQDLNSSSIAVEYMNKTKNLNKYEITTSNPKILQVLQPSITVGPSRKVQIPIVLLDRSYSSKHYFVYIYNEGYLRPTDVIELIFD